MDNKAEIIALRQKYQVTAWGYDLLNFPWERQYRRWRPHILADIHGQVLEAGVGTGQNLAWYAEDVALTGVDLSPAMLRFARLRVRRAHCQVQLCREDATRLTTIPNAAFDWYVATFLFCVLPDAAKPVALAQMLRVLKPGGRFCLLEIIASRRPWIRASQQALAPLFRWLYGARFDGHTLACLERMPGLRVTHIRFLKDDTYLLIKGEKSH